MVKNDSHGLDVIVTAEFAAAVRVCRELGVSSFSIGTLSVQLESNHNLSSDPGPHNVESPPQAPARTRPLTDPLTNPASDDEILFWSAGGSGIKGALPDFSDTDFDIDKEDLP